MSELLTVKEVQDLLKIDRITVYRMLKDGRLTGAKIGHQWRFPRDEIDALLAGTHPTRGDDVPALTPQALPLHCVQMIQNVFSDVAQVASVTTGPDGEPLTEFSNSCAFCNLIMSSEEGRRGCVASWRRLSEQRDSRPQYATCHAGLQYARGRIELNGQLVAMIIAGQYYTTAPDPEEEAARIAALAEKYDINPRDLAEAARCLPVLEERKRAQMGDWLEKVARTFEDIGRERAELISRLRTIAAMSAIDMN